jgi:hypothetical protein
VTAPGWGLRAMAIPMLLAPVSRALPALAVPELI